MYYIDYSIFSVEHNFRIGEFQCLPLAHYHSVNIFLETL